MDDVAPRLIRGAAVCPEPPAAVAAADAYGAGGNAVDAAVAGAFAQAVSNPLGTGLTGMCHIMLLRAGDTAPVYLNASVEIGSRATSRVFAADFVGRSERAGRYLIKNDRNQFGYQSIMTPGFVGGMDYLLTHGEGYLDWAEVVAPAARLASDGFSVYPYLADYFTLEGPTRPGYPDIFRKLQDEGPARDTYLPRGEPIPAGETLRQAAYGKTLERIAKAGADDFYRGDIARTMSADLDAHHAFVAASDLSAYRVRSETPVSITFDDLTIYSAPPPSQGIVLLTMLRLVEGVDFTSMEWNGPDYVELMAWATRTAFAECLPYLADPGFVDVPIDWLLSSERLAPVQAERQEIPHRAASGMSDHTSHISACDTAGNIVSITHSIGSITGAGVLTPELGFFYNNFLGHFNVLGGYHDSIVPGKRMGGGCPTIVFRGGRPWLAIGSSGGPRLVSAVFQTLLNISKFGMSLQEAVAAPRIHCEQGKLLYIEPTYPEHTRAMLEQRGYTLTVAAYMGCNQAVALDGDTIQTGTDPRGGQGIGTGERTEYQRGNHRSNQPH